MKGTAALVLSYSRVRLCICWAMNITRRCRIRNFLTHLFGKKIMLNDKQQLDEALQRELWVRRHQCYNSFQHVILSFREHFYVCWQLKMSSILTEDSCVCYFLEINSHIGKEIDISIFAFLCQLLVMWLFLQIQGAFRIDEIRRVQPTPQDEMRVWWATSMRQSGKVF